MRKILALMGRYGVLLGLFALVSTAMLALVYRSTVEQIAANEEAELQRRLTEVLPASYYDNALLEHVVMVTDPALLGSKAAIAVYLGTRAGMPSAAVLAPIAPDGYTGPIRLLVGITIDGVITGVRVVSHRETPGLGDGIEVERSDWILGFNGASHSNPPRSRWRVKKDGGEFDQFTGATVSPRAIVKAIDKALLYFERHREVLFAQQ